MPSFSAKRLKFKDPASSRLTTGNHQAFIVTFSAHGSLHCELLNVFAIHVIPRLLKLTGYREKALPPLPTHLPKIFCAVEVSAELVCQVFKHSVKASRSSTPEKNSLQ